MAISNLEGTYNFRDTGGMPLVGGGRTRSGVLYRSDAISNLTPQGLQQLSGSGISVIVDYRTPAEVQMAPDRLPVSVEFTKVDLPLLEGAFTGTAQEAMQRAGLHPEAAASAVQAALARLPVWARSTPACSSTELPSSQPQPGP